MRKILLTAIFTIISTIAFTQERIAVFPFEDLNNVLTQNEAIFFYRQFSNEFTNRSGGKFITVPRVDVEKLFNIEAAFQLKDLSSRAKTAEMEKVLNGTQILSGLIGKMGNSIAISISLYTFPEFKQLPGGVDIRVANTGELFDKIPELVQSMQNEIASSGAKADTTPAPKRTYSIGDKGPGGGIVFDVNSDRTGGKEVAQLGTHGAGKSNTVARNHQGGGFSDWSLIDGGELNLVYVNLKSKGIGSFPDGYYYCSNGFSNVINFRNGKRGDQFGSTYYILTVRSF